MGFKTTAGARRLHEWMRLTGNTQADVAEIVNLSQAAVSKILSGENRPQLETAQRIRLMTSGFVLPQDFNNTPLFDAAG